MKGYVSAAFLLALVLSAHGLIRDKSILDEFRCKSILIVQVAGYGMGIHDTEARTKCAADCGTGIEMFKNDRCPALCGLYQYRRKTSMCNLCFPSKDIHIGRCRKVMQVAAEKCKRGCKTNPTSSVSGHKKVKGDSGIIIIKFPSKITK